MSGSRFGGGLGVRARLFALGLALSVLAAVVVSSQAVVSAAVGAGPLAGFSLLDASDQSVVATLGDGDTVELGDPGGGSWAVRADIAAGESVGSVHMALAGPVSHAQTESWAPYSLYGDERRSGVRYLHGRALPAGDYTLTATAYSSRRRGGDQLGTLEVSFSVAQTPPPPESGAGPLAGFSLLDASNQSLLAALGDGDTVQLDDPDSGDYAIRADLAEGESAGSVHLELTGPVSNSRTESWAPYSLYGDERRSGVRYLHGGGALPAGDYTLTATAYALRYQNGDVLGTLQVAFTITQHTPPPPTPTPTPTPPPPPPTPPTPLPRETTSVEPPGAPQNLAAATVSGAIALSWDAPADATGVTGYQVLRRNLTADPPEDLAVLAADTGSPAPFYTDTAVTGGTAYEYQVKAVNSAGAGQGSNTATAIAVTEEFVVAPDNDPQTSQQNADSLNTTLTVATPHRSSLRGCWGNGGEWGRWHSCDRRLGDNDFPVARTRSLTPRIYEVESLYIVPGIDKLYIETNRKLINRHQLTLHIGSESFDFADATFRDNYYGWSRAGVSWTGNQQVNVRITQDHDLPDVSPVRNLRATVRWGQVKLSWQQPADFSETRKRCSANGGELHYDIWRHAAATAAGLASAGGTQIATPLLISNITYTDNGPSNAGLTLGQYYRYDVHTICEKTGSFTVEIVRIDVFMPNIPTITQLFGGYHTAPNGSRLIDTGVYLWWDITSLPRSTHRVSYYHLSRPGSSPAPLGFKVERCDSSCNNEDNWHEKTDDNNGNIWFYDGDGFSESFRITPRIFNAATGNAVDGTTSRVTRVT